MTQEGTARSEAGYSRDACWAFREVDPESIIGMQVKVLLLNCDLDRDSFAERSGP